MSLKILNDISSIVTNYTKKAPFQGAEAGSKTGKLIEGILSGTWENDEDAARELYGKPLNGRSFDMLKSRAKEQLINAVFLLDTKRKFKSSYDRAYFQAGKEMVAGLIFLRQNRENLGLTHLNHAFQLSIKYDFTDYKIVCLKFMRYFSSFSGSMKMFNFYNSELTKALKTQECELLSDEINQKAILLFGASAASQSEKTSSLRQYHNEVIKLNKTYDTYTTRMNMYRIGIRLHDASADYYSLIQVADDCENYLRSKPHFSQKVRIGEMNLNKLYACLHLRKLKQGTEYANNCKILFKSGTLNYIIYLEYHFLLCVHTNNIGDANNIFYEATTHSNFSSYPERIIEKWKIFEAFLHYALPETRENKKRFNTARFINEVPIFSKDKAGYNLSIIIAQVILLIKAGEFEKVVEKAEALKLYASRYIKKEKSPRSYYFIKMLLVMIKYDFEPAKTEEIAEKFFVKLKATHMGEQNQLETLEVIPYDLLWPRLLEQLRKNG